MNGDPGAHECDKLLRIAGNCIKLRAIATKCVSFRHRVTECVILRHLCVSGATLSRKLAVDEWIDARVGDGEQKERIRERGRCGCCGILVYLIPQRHEDIWRPADDESYDDDDGLLQDAQSLCSLTCFQLHVHVAQDIDALDCIAKYEIEMRSV